MSGGCLCEVHITGFDLPVMFMIESGVCLFMLLVLMWCGNDSV